MKKKAGLNERERKDPTKPNCMANEEKMYKGVMQLEEGLKRDSKPGKP